MKRQNRLRQTIRSSELVIESKTSLIQ